MNNRQLFLSQVAQTSDAPLLLEIERAEGIYLFGADGKKYIDLISGISVSNLGHAHPKIIAAIEKQLHKHAHLMVYGEFVQSAQVQLAQQLCQLLPEKLDNVYFVNSGSEATEGAIKLVRRYTNRTELISFKKSYHGSTTGSLSLMGDEYFKQNYRPLLPDTRQICYNSMKDLEQISEKTAAVFFEPVQAESGITVPDKAYVQALRKKCDEQGVLLVVDEIQTAFGRTGKLFAFEHYEIVPDVLLLAKALGGGLPIGAFVAHKKVMRCFTEKPVLGHITTFGGNAVCCASALAAIHVLQEEKLTEQVTPKAQLFKEMLDVRKNVRFTQAGLMMALHFDSYETNKKIIDRCIELGVVTDWFLFEPAALRICPPLIIREEEIIAACNVINQATEEVLG